MKYNKLLNNFTNMCQRILGGNLTGVYLHGSAVMGCFHPLRNDLDLLVIVEEEVSLRDRLAFLKEMAALNEEAPAKGIEMSVVRRRFCNPFVYPTPFELHFSVSHLKWYREDPEDYAAKMQGTDKDLAAHFTILKKYGMVLYGEGVEAVFGEVPPQAYKDSICEDVADAVRSISADPVYMTLNLCRVLAYLREGLILSKRGGGEWGIEALPDRFHGLVRRALFCYEAGEEMKAGAEEGACFAAYMTEEIRFCRSAESGVSEILPR